jgi:hypothetical protein
MIKLFFATFFIAELIIALAVITKIRQFDKCVNSLNALVSDNKHKIRDGLKDFKWLLVDCVNSFNKMKSHIQRKKEEYLFSAMKTSLIYASIFLLKGKYKKSIIAYQFLSEVYSGFKEAECWLL